MFRRLLSALIPMKPFRGLRMALVLDPSNAVETTGVRHRLILGGKVIDLVREGKPSTKGKKL
jgi:hypothetical protein